MAQRAQNLSRTRASSGLPIAARASLASRMAYANTNLTRSLWPSTGRNVMHGKEIAIYPSMSVRAVRARTGPSAARPTYMCTITRVHASKDTAVTTAILTSTSAPAVRVRTMDNAANRVPVRIPTSATLATRLGHHQGSRLMHIVAHAQLGWETAFVRLMPRLVIRLASAATVVATVMWTLTSARASHARMAPPANRQA